MTSEDSGELITAAYCFGIPHPPGYPLWTILAGGFLRILQVGSVAWRVNIFSGLCASVGLGFFSVTLRELGVRSWSALAASLTVAFGAVLWSQSVIAEVYTLYALCFAVALWSVVRWEATRNTRYLILASAVIGLGMCNHHLMALSAVALAFWVLSLFPTILLKPALLLACIGAFLVALAPYGYLYLRAQADPPMNWGEPKSVAALLEHVTRKQYRSADPTRASPPKSLSTYVNETKTVGLYVLREATPYVAPVAVAGLAFLIARRRKVLLLWALLTAGHVGLYLILMPLGNDRAALWCCKVFFIGQYLSMGILIAFGLDAGLSWVMQRLRGRATGLRFLIAPSALLVALIPLLRHWPENNYRRYWYAEDHARNLLASALPNAIIFPTGDHNTFPVIYMTAVEGVRADVTIADKYGYIDPALYQDMPGFEGRRPQTPEERDAIEEWIIRHARRPVYYTVRKESLVDNADAVPVGVLYHLLPQTKQLDTETPWTRIRYRNLDPQCEAPRDYGADNILADFEFFRGLRQLHQGHESAALERFTQAGAYGWGIKEISNNIGSALAENGLADKSITYFEQASQWDPKYTTSRWNTARVLKALRRWENAENVFEELAEITPNDFRIFGELGFLGLKLDRPKQVVRTRFERSLVLNPYQPQIIEALPLLEASGEPITNPPPENNNLATTLTPSSPSADTSTGPPLLFDEIEWDFGVVEPGEELEHQFTFVCGHSPIRITGLRTNCSCVRASIDRFEWSPGDAGDIIVNLTSSRKPNKATIQKVFIDIDGKERVVDLLVRSRTRPEFTMDPPILELHVPRGAAVACGQAVFRREGGGAFSLRDVKASSPRIQAQVALDVLALEHVVDVEVDCSALEGSFEAIVTVFPEIELAGSIELPVRVVVDPQELASIDDKE